MSSMEQQDERRILGQMVRFQNQAAVRIDNDCVNGLGGTSLRSQDQAKENKALFHPFISHRKLSTSPGCKAKRMELIEIAKTKIAEVALACLARLERNPLVG